MIKALCIVILLLFVGVASADWTIEVRYDKDQDDVGYVTAIWNDTTYERFTYSRRVHATAAEVDRFVAEAIAARDAWQTKQGANDTGEVYVLDRINTADPQVP